MKNITRYEYYSSHHKTVSYIWKHKLIKDGFQDCGEFEVRIRGPERVVETEQICYVLNAAEKVRRSNLR